MTQPTLTPTATLRDAVRRIEEVRRGIAVVLDAEGRLLGTVTDGDIRRAILKEHRLDAPVSAAMNTNPTTADAASPESYLAALLDERGLEALPLVDSAGRFVRIAHVRDLDREEEWGGGEGFAAAVIMAGGEGQRLRPLTADMPKPMVEVGGVPLIERLVRSLVRAGVPRIYISVNYLGHLIEEHLGDGSAFGTPIIYLRETEKMGTAGALSLLPKMPSAPIMLINGDVLHGSDYRNLLTYHAEHGAAVTVGAIEYRVDIPYGVLRAEGSRLLGLQEKPSQRFLCNAGLYVLSPETLKLVPRGESFDMPELINATMKNGGEVCVFPIHEYWADVGNVHDLERAQDEVKRLGGTHG